MGRRSTNTTKSGKYMNPTDRARKEARRRELKKNKKQRMAVRQAVLKSKDASVLLEEAALYDRQEYDPKSTTTLSERVLQEKRKKLMETFDRMIALYKKEDPERANELLTMKNEYDRKKNEMILFYEQVKLAEKVKATEIPLPEIPPQNITGLPQYPGDIPLPPGLNLPPHPSVLAAAAMTSLAVPTKSILKKSDPLAIPGPPPGLPTLHKKPVAPPPGTPDELSEADTSSDEESVEDTEGQFNRDSDDDSQSGRSLGDNEDSIVVKNKRIRFADSHEKGASDEAMTKLALMQQVSMNSVDIPTPMTQIPTLIPNPGGFMHPSNIPVPTGLPPPIPMVGAPGLHPNPTSISVPPQMFGQVSKNRIPIQTKKVSDIPLPQAALKKQQLGIPTIEAKPQLKNLIGDSTKLVPTSLRIKKTKVPPTKILNIMSDKSRKAPEVVTSKDDAYDQFMKEMEGLL